MKEARFPWLAALALRSEPREATLDQEGETDPKQRGGTDREDGGHYPDIVFTEAAP